MHKSTEFFKSTFVPILIILSTFTLIGCGSDSSPAPDDVPPVITLTGDTSITIFQNITYVEPGADASDNVDGTVKVTTTGTVNETINDLYPGTYILESKGLMWSQAYIGDPKSCYVFSDTIEITAYADPKINVISEEQPFFATRKYMTSIRN